MSIMVKYPNKKDLLLSDISGRYNWLKTSSDLDAKYVCKTLKEVLPGLATYEKPSTQETDKFIAKMDPRKKRNIMILFILYTFCLLVNFLSLTVKQNAENVYLLNKQV